MHSDPDLTRGYPIPDKRATLRLLELLRNPHAANLPAAGHELPESTPSA
jgi:hypothetical protein